MPETLRVQPDTEFIHDVMESGGGDLKKCYQCATCVSVCSLAGESRPFPRKQVIQAQWGMKDQLLGDPAVWLCHNCGDCNTRCPRGARPGDVMGAIRREAIKRFAFPRFMGDLISNTQAGPFMLVLSAMVLLAIAVLPPQGAEMRLPVFAAMFPQARVEALFFVVAGLVLVALTVQAARFTKRLRAAGADGPILPALGPVLVEIVSHRRFAECTSEHGRRSGHLFVILGFSGLAIMGTVTGVGTMVGLIHTPLPLLSPLKVFANVCALAIFTGMTLLLLNRLRSQQTRSSSTFFDWFLLVVLGGAVVTGIVSEITRLAQYQHSMFFIYYLHLTLILTLFVGAPYSKFVHFVYRTIAMAATWESHERSTQAQNSSSWALPPAAGFDANLSAEEPARHQTSS